MSKSNGRIAIIDVDGEVPNADLKSNGNLGFYAQP